MSGRLIAVASGKGGVGKTWLAVTLAHALAERGTRPLLVDADFGLANVDVQLGVDPTTDLASVLSGRATVRDAAIGHPGGFDILCGRSGSGALASLDAAVVRTLCAALRSSAAIWPVVLLDLGAGLDRSVRDVAAAADTLLVVATEEPTSLTDAYAVLKLHRTDRAAGDQRVVINQARDAGSGAQTWHTLDQACSRFLGGGVQLAGVVRRDAKVPDAIRRQTSILTRHPNCAAAEDVRALAAAL